MIRDCVSAVVIWVDNSGVIAENLELLKKLRRPTYVYEYSSTKGVVSSGMIDPDRIYRTHYLYKRRKRMCARGFLLDPAFLTNFLVKYGARTICVTKHIFIREGK